MIKIKVKRWRWCQHCQRTIFRNEKAYKIKGMQYVICKECKK